MRQEEEKIRKKLTGDDEEIMAEVYAARAIREEMEKTRIREGSRVWRMIVLMAGKFIMAHRQEIRDIYQKSKYCEQEGKGVNVRNAIRSEDTEQINVMEWARWNVNKYPELKWIHHIPNGGSRNKREAVKLKQMGVKAGVSDICLPYPKGIYCGLYIEMKFGNNRKTEEQKEFLQDMEKVGHFVATCYSAEDAIRVIEEYLNLGRVVLDDGKTVYMSIPNNSTIKDGVIRETRRGGRGNKDQT